MKLPQTSASPIFWIDPSERFVLRNELNEVTSVIEKQTDLPLIGKAGNRPLWDPTVFNGLPGLVFQGNNRLSLDFPSNFSFNSALNAPMCITAAVYSTHYVFGQIGFALGNSGSLSPEYSLAFSHNNLIPPFPRYVIVKRTNDSGAQQSFTYDGGQAFAPHIYSMIFTGDQLIIRQDRVEMNSISVPEIDYLTLNQLTLGAYGEFAAGTYGDHFFDGSIGMVTVHSGLGPLYDIENFMMDYYSL